MLTAEQVAKAVEDLLLDYQSDHDAAEFLRRDRLIAGLQRLVERVRS